jgi:hypothetical protein
MLKYMILSVSVVFDELKTGVENRQLFGEKSPIFSEDCDITIVLVHA